MSNIIQKILNLLNKKSNEIEENTIIFTFDTGRKIIIANNKSNIFALLELNINVPLLEKIKNIKNLEFLKRDSSLQNCYDIVDFIKYFYKFYSLDESDNFLKKLMTPNYNVNLKFYKLNEKEKQIEKLVSINDIDILFYKICETIKNINEREIFKNTKSNNKYRYISSFKEKPSFLEKTDIPHEIIIEVSGYLDNENKRDNENKIIERLNTPKYVNKLPNSFEYDLKNVYEEHKRVFEEEERKRFLKLKEKYSKQKINYNQQKSFFEKLLELGKIKSSNFISYDVKKPKIKIKKVKPDVKVPKEHNPIHGKKFVGVFGKVKEQKMKETLGIQKGKKKRFWELK